MSRDVVACLVAASAWGGAVVGMTVPLLLCGSGGVVLLVVGVLAVRWRSAGTVRIAVTVLVLCSLVFAALACASAVRVSSAASSPLAVLADHGSTARVRLVTTGDAIRLRDGSGVIQGAPRGYRMTARVETVMQRGTATGTRSSVLLLVPQSWSDIVPGTPIEAVLRWSPADEPGLAAVGSARASPRILGPPPWLQRAAEVVRAGLVRAADPAHGRAGAALVPALVVGDTSAVPESVVDDMRAAGLSHITAVSGANVAIILGLMLLLARWAGFRGRWVLAVGLASVGFFVVLARPEPSVLRAAVMGVIGLAAVLRGGQRRPLAALAGAVVLLLVVDPFLAAELGFVLSVLATAGLVLVAPWWVVRLERFLPRTVAQALGIAIGAQLMVSPVIAAVSGRVQPVSLPANLLAEPAVAPATVLGFLAALVSPANGTAAHALAWLAAWPAGWIIGVAGWGARLPAATLPWPAGWVGGLSIATLLLVCMAAVLVGVRRSAVLALAVAAVALVVLPTAGARQWPVRGWAVIACDVGQGDALLLSTGRGSAVLVDAGPDVRPVDRCLRDAGIHTLDAVVLTHFHVDHVQGLAGAVRGRSVGPILVSPLAEPAEQAGRVAAIAAQVGSQELVVRQGANAVIGPWRLTVLAPSPDVRALRTPADGGSPPNNASIVLLAERAGLRVLLTGDVELTAQAGLVASSAQAISGVDVLKVPHHGSAVQDPAFLGLAAPRVALISVGRPNTYGHPAPVTLQILQRIGAVVGRTDDDGDLAVVGGGGGLRLVRRGG